MLQIAFGLLAAFQSVTQTVPADEIKDALSHAEALYYGARFNESIALLSRVDDALQSQPGRLQEKTDTKLRLALAYIGLNDTAKAKSFLMGLYALNADYELDAKQFPPKVMNVAADAKAEQTKARCFTAQTDARTYLDGGQTKKFVDLLRSMGSKCTVLAAMGPEAAETFYKSGLAAYKRNEFPNALSSFEAALALSPEHELAREYVDLTQNKLQLGQDRLVVQWQRDFNGRQFAAAAADYREIVSANSGRNVTTVNRVADEYRKALTSLVENWNKACAGGGDVANLNAIRGQIADLLPEPSFGADIRSQMVSCEAPKKVAVADAVAPVAAKPNVPAACLEMQTALALARLKTRVDPYITSDLRTYLKNNVATTVRVKVKISETGDVTVTGMPDGNPILNNTVRNAVLQWKFIPIRDQSGPRCVDTEIPIVLKVGG
jgi:tetratricopeptide (TPR) repeat protein